MTKLIVKPYREDEHHVTGMNYTLVYHSAKHRIVEAKDKIREWENACSKCNEIDETSEHI